MDDAKMTLYPIAGIDFDKDLLIFNRRKKTRRSRKPELGRPILEHK